MMMKFKKKVIEKMKWRLKRSMKKKECVKEHEDIVNLEKTLSNKMKTFVANKPKKVMGGGGSSQFFW
jgi:ribosome biogenesis GTPase A